MTFAILAAFVAVMGALSPAKAQQTAPLYCNITAFYSASSTGAARIITAPPSGGTYICGYAMNASGAVSLSLEYATTGTSCGSGVVALTPPFPFTTASTPLVDRSPAYRGMFVPPGNDLCVLASAAVAAQVQVFAYQHPGELRSADRQQRREDHRGRATRRQR